MSGNDKGLNGSTSVSIEDNISADPVSIFASLRLRFPGECFLLESVEGPKKIARYSFIGAEPMSVFKSKGDEVTIDGRTFTTPDPYGALKEHFGTLHNGTTDFAPFSGGMIGYIGYGMVRYFENIPLPEPGEKDLPDMHFFVPRHLICIDHANGRAFLRSHGKMAELKDAYAKARPLTQSTLMVQDWKPDVDKERFEEMVSKAKERIMDGDIFQVVLSRKADFRILGDPIELYKALRAVNPSPYLFYLDFENMQLIGSSPEMLVRLEGRKLTTRPLAGTRPRSSDVEEDEKLKLEMILDEKERAEHLMLVDLHRNDMGRVSKFGSVKVTDLMSVEKYSHVQHIVSNIESELSEGQDAFDALKSCFPAGTVSGAPKIKAMEIIGELEGCPRGPYGGAVGYFDFTGNMDFAITIRSIVVSGDRASLQAGAGIVADSDPTREYNETGHKMQAMLQALKVVKGGDR
jgi:anthranilate synthase component 1